MFTKRLLFSTLLLLTFITGIAQADKKANMKGGNHNGLSSFNGAWRSDDNKGFSVMHDGYFNSVGQDSSGKWDDVHAGTYTVNPDNTISFKVMYSSYPDHVGAINTAEYTMNGNTVKMRHFKKLINAEGKDVTAEMPKDAWETIVRVQ